MNVPFRLYGQPGCPHCEKAAQFFVGAQVPAQFVVVGNDPIALEGIKKCLGSETVSIPCLVSAVSAQPEIIVGFKEEDFSRVVEAYRALVRANTPSVPAAEGVNSGPAAQVAEPSAPPAAGAAQVPGVSGHVDGPIVVERLPADGPAAN